MVGGMDVPAKRRNEAGGVYNDFINTAPWVAFLVVASIPRFWFFKTLYLEKRFIKTHYSFHMNCGVDVDGNSY